MDKEAKQPSVGAMGTLEKQKGDPMLDKGASCYRFWWGLLYNNFRQGSIWSILIPEYGFLLKLVRASYQVLKKRMSIRLYPEKISRLQKNARALHRLYSSNHFPRNGLICLWFLNVASYILKSTLKHGRPTVHEEPMFSRRGPQSSVEEQKKRDLWDENPMYELNAAI